MHDVLLLIASVHLTYSQPLVRLYAVPADALEALEEQEEDEEVDEDNQDL